MSTDRQPVSFATPSGGSLGSPEVAQFREQVKHGNLAGLREYLSRSREERDWQDRLFVVDLVVGDIPTAVMDFACEAEPEAADLALLRCAHFADLALKRRGTGTCDKVAEQSYRDAATCINVAMVAVEKAAKLDPHDPTAHACMLRPLGIFEELLPRVQHEFMQVTLLAPDLVQPYRIFVSNLSERWHGSHEYSVRFARTALTKAGPGSDMPACLFWAHLLAQTHFEAFDNDARGGAAYLRKSEVVSELNAAFDRWIEAPYSPRRSSVPYLHYAACWFYLVGDAVRLQRALALANYTFCEDPWSMIEGNAVVAFGKAMLMIAANRPPTDANYVDLVPTTLGMIAGGSDEIRGGRFKRAQATFSVTLDLVRSARPEQRGHMMALVMLNQCRLCQAQKLGNPQELREKALALLDAEQVPMESARFHHLMADVLTKLSESQRALPFWEKAISLAGEEIESGVMAGMLNDMGICYNRIGLRDFAAVPLRTAVKLFGANPEDPRLCAALINLGMALSKSSPAEAEACYKQAGDLYSAKMQYQSATSAWLNLGVLYSDLGREAESLECYQRVLKVREQTRDTPPAGIALVLNNMACSYRRQGRFKEAHNFIDRAIKILPSGAALMGGAFETRGRIYLDAGEDKRAAEWLGKSVAEQRKQPSPNLEGLAETLEFEIVALKRLRKDKDAVAAEALLASVRASMQGIERLDPVVGAVKARPEGAVMVELPFGNRPVRPEVNKNTRLLAARLSKEVREQNAGYYVSQIAVPENTTLIFYGPDAEMLFRAMEPSLASEPLSAGANVLIRQGAMRREVVMARPTQMVN